MPGRKFSAGNSYRYGFNGKENDNEVKGEGNQQDYGMRIYDPRLGRFLSIDPLQEKYADLTPYQFAANRPIDGIDLDGLEWYKAVGDWLYNQTAYGFVTNLGKTINAAANKDKRAVVSLLSYSGTKALEGKDAFGSNGTSNQKEEFVTGLILDGISAYALPKLAHGKASTASKLASEEGAGTARENVSSTTVKQTSAANGGKNTSLGGQTETPILTNKSNSLTSEAIVKQKLTSALEENQAILDKPRIYIGDGTSGKYAVPDFAVYNTKTGEFIKLVDAKDGNATFTKAQQQINDFGGIFKGSSRAPKATPQVVKPHKNAIQIERTNVGAKTQ